MHDQIETLFGSGPYVMLRELAELFFGHSKRVLSSCIAVCQAEEAILVRRIQHVELMRGCRLRKDIAHPCPLLNRIRGEIQDDGRPGIQ